MITVVSISLYALSICAATVFGFSLTSKEGSAAVGLAPTDQFQETQEDKTDAGN